MGEGRYDKVHDFIERRISDIDRRRDCQLDTRLISFEKLMNKTVEVKTISLQTILSRLQDDTKMGDDKCVAQINEFYSKINAINLKIQDIEINLRNIQKDNEERDKEIDDSRIKIQSLIDWKNGFFIRFVPIMVTVVTIIINILLFGIEQIVNHIKLNIGV